MSSLVEIYEILFSIFPRFCSFISKQTLFSLNQALSWCGLFCYFGITVLYVNVLAIIDWSPTGVWTHDFRSSKRPVVIGQCAEHSAFRVFIIRSFEIEMESSKTTIWENRSNTNCIDLHTFSSGELNSMKI